jgi:hypothetical protein
MHLGFRNSHLIRLPLSLSVLFQTRAVVGLRLSYQQRNVSKMSRRFAGPQRGVARGVVVLLAAAAALRAPICVVHGLRYAGGLPRGGFHPIGADHCPEREPSRAWSAGLPRCFGRAEAQCAEVCMSAEGARPKDLGTLDGSRGGLMLPRRVKATHTCTCDASRPVRKTKCSWC